MEIIPDQSIIGRVKNPHYIPKESITINSYYELWTYNDPFNPTLIESHELLLVNDFIDKKNIEFGVCNFSFESKIIRSIDNHYYDNINNGILIVYNQYENELAYFLIVAIQARYDQILFRPFNIENKTFKYYRNKFLINKFKRVSLNLGKIIKFIFNIYVHIHYKPHGIGYFICRNDFYSKVIKYK